MFGVWTPETRTWLETPFGQTQEFHTFSEAAEEAREVGRLFAKSGETYVVRQIGRHGMPVE